MTQPAKSQEPSMEEILASIRRIIADDDSGKTGQRPPEAPKAAAPAGRPMPPPAPAAPRAAPPPPVEAQRPPAMEPMNGTELEDQPADILDLTESMAAPMPSQSAPMPSLGARPSPAPQFRTIEPNSDLSFEEASEPPPSHDFEEASHHPAYNGGDHRGQLMSSEATAAVDSAFNTLAQTVLAQNSRTLEDLVREMLRPMLKNWLDDNLPGMVERLVRAEIERVARGRAG